MEETPIYGPNACPLVILKALRDESHITPPLLQTIR